MMLLLLLTTTVVPDGSTANAKRAEIIAAWKARYAKIQTVEYRLEGDDIVTPVFFAGLPDPSDYLEVRRRPMELAWKLDFTQRKAWVRKSFYVWQVDLRQFEHLEREYLFDFALDRVAVWNSRPRSEPEREIRIDLTAVAIGTLNEMETLPLWFNNGIVGSVGSAKPLELPNYRLADSERWTVLDNGQGAKDGREGIEIRHSNSRRRVVLSLDSSIAFLPIRFRTIVRGNEAVDINVTYAMHDGLPLADKWAATFFSSSGKLARHVELKVVECRINKPIEFPPMPAGEVSDRR